MTELEFLDQLLNALSEEQPPAMQAIVEMVNARREMIWQRSIPFTTEQQELLAQKAREVDADTARRIADIDRALFED
jgi:hypothetical protein